METPQIVYEAPFELELYPNPANNLVFLKQNAVPPVELEVAVFTAAGSLWKTIKTEEWETPLETADWPAGIYWLQVRRHNEQPEIKKLVVMNR